MLSLLLLAAGCGSDSSDSTSESSSTEVTIETGSLSKAQFIAKASALCEATQKRFESEFNVYVKKQQANPITASEGSPETELVEKSVVPNMQKQVDDIAALGAPSGDEEKLSEFLNSLQQVVDETSEDPKSFVRSQGSFGDAPKLAKAYGLVGCAQLI